MRSLRLLKYASCDVPTFADVRDGLNAWCTKSVPANVHGSFERSSVLSVQSVASSDVIKLSGFGCDNGVAQHESEDVDSNHETATGLIAAFWSWEGLIVVYRDGSVFALDDGDTSLCISLCSADSKLVCADRSPDGDVLASIDSSCNLTFVECSSWTELRAWNLSSDAKLEKGTAPVSVGWGSEKTQFKGAGVALAERQGKSVGGEADSSTDGHPTDDGQTYLSWRGDGELLAVSHSTPSDGRILRVFDRRGSHLFSSLPGVLERCLAWQPSGSVIASTKHFGDKLNVVLFEKNCKAWSEFVLVKGKPAEAFLTAMEWNSTSEILAVALSSPESGRTVQLWTRTNYHWDLKFVIAAEEELPKFLWDAEASYRLHVVYPSRYEAYEFLPSVVTSNDDKDAWVAVVDGTSVRLTPAGKRVFPPPMCAQEISVGASVSAVVFSASDGEIFCVTKNFISRFDLRTTNGSAGLYELCGKYECESDLRTFGSWMSVGPNQLVAVKNSTASVFTLDRTSSCVSLVEFPSKLQVDGICGENGMVKVITGAKEIFSWDFASNNALPSGKKLGQPGTSCHNLLFDGQRNLVFGLSNSGSKLFCYDWEIMRGVTSFRLHGKKFLLVTTGGTDSWLWCFGLERIAKQLERTDRSCGLEDLGVRRRAENGARIVTSCVEASSVILQMPRGNLETVYPREILLSTVSDWLDRCEYSPAYTSMRRHRVNLNIICDHNASLFLENGEKFVADVIPDHIAQFLLDLSAEDVSTTLYRGSYGSERKSTWISVLKPENGPATKVDSVCLTLRRVMMNLDGIKFMRPILASFARMTIPELESALFFLADQKEEKLIDDGLRYLMYLVDADALFDVALGTYDLKMAVMVAERSQRDPKEWVPFLEQYRGMESPFREYSIDVRLKRWHSALKHLSECCKSDPTYEEECLKLVSDKGLFQSGLRIFPRGSEMHTRICRDYGDKLATANRKQEAGLIYSLGELNQEAARVFALSGEEDLCVKAFNSIPDPTKDSKAELGRILANALANKRDFRSASRVALEWSEDKEESVRFLLDGHLWMAAAHLSCDDEGVKAKLLSYVEESVQAFQKTEAQILARTERLLAVFNSKFEEAMVAGDGENFPDVISETETAGSEASVGSHARSTSNRSQTSVARRKKKEERKSRSLREGSRTEDIALVTWLHSAVADVIADKTEVREALLQLTAMNEENAGKNLQDAFRSVLEVASTACNKVWPNWLNMPNLGLDESSSSAPSQANFGPGTSAADLVTAFARTASYRKFVRSRFLFMEPGIRFAPNLKLDSSWSLSILASNEDADRGPRVRGREEYGFV